MLNTYRSPITETGEIAKPGAPVLAIDISLDYPQHAGVLRRVRLEVMPGEIVGLIGQSGSGKSTIALSILGLLDHTGARTYGRRQLLGRDLSRCDERDMRSIRGRVIGLVPQSPAAALNPALRIGTQIREAWRAHSRKPWATQKDRILELLASAGISPDEEFLRRFPGQISIGQAQRVLIVMALLHAPALMIADEPTSALDVITQKEVLDLLIRMIKQREMSMLFISHDILSVAAVCHRVAILDAGEIVETGSVKQVFSQPQHAYTKRLVAAVPAGLHEL